MLLHCSRGVLWGEAWGGATQGDPESGPYFSRDIQKYLLKVDAMLAADGGCSSCIWDDGYWVSPWSY